MTLGPVRIDLGQWRFVSRHAVFVLVLSSAGCVAGSGSAWMSEPLGSRDPRPQMPRAALFSPSPSPSPSTPPSPSPSPSPSSVPPPPDPTHVVGIFRNTYYDFPRESDYGGPTVALMTGACRTIATVPRAFYEAVCVQGSGTLSRGKTVSFARRDCDCAEVCPRTGQRICFDALDAARFPWGRGAAGRAITPLVTVAADTRVLPLGTPIYVPEFDGVERNDARMHDGCFVVEDRGVRVQGNHIDVFTGDEASTLRMNRVVPSNKGVTVVVDEPRCEHLRR
jgi:3D (Asp-Asp-Asp) domain-containing protein